MELPSKSSSTTLASTSMAVDTASPVASGSGSGSGSNPSRTSALSMKDGSSSHDPAAPAVTSSIKARQSFSSTMAAKPISFSLNKPAARPTEDSPPSKPSTFEAALAEFRSSTKKTRRSPSHSPPRSSRRHQRPPDEYSRSPEQYRRRDRSPEDGYGYPPASKRSRYDDEYYEDYDRRDRRYSRSPPPSSRRRDDDYDYRHSIGMRDRSPPRRTGDVYHSTRKKSSYDAYDSEEEERRRRNRSSRHQESPPPPPSKTTAIAPRRDRSPPPTSKDHKSVLPPPKDRHDVPATSSATRLSRPALPPGPAKAIEPFHYKPLGTKDHCVLYDPELDKGKKGKEVQTRFDGEGIESGHVTDPRRNRNPEQIERAKKNLERAKRPVRKLHYHWDSNSTGPAPSRASSAVIVTGFPPLTTPQDLRKSFVVHGLIETIDIKIDPRTGGNLGICWIKYVDHAPLADADDTTKKQYELNRKSGKAQDGHAAAKLAIDKNNGASVGIRMLNEGSQVKVEMDDDGSKSKAAFDSEMKLRYSLPKSKSSASTVRPNDGTKGSTPRASTSGSASLPQRPPSTSSSNPAHPPPLPPSTRTSVWSTSTAAAPPPPPPPPSATTNGLRLGPAAPIRPSTQISPPHLRGRYQSHSVSSAIQQATQRAVKRLQRTKSRDEPFSDDEEKEDDRLDVVYSPSKERLPSATTNGLLTNGLSKLGKYETISFQPSEMVLRDRLDENGKGYLLIERCDFKRHPTRVYHRGVEIVMRELEAMFEKFGFTRALAYKDGMYMLFSTIDGARRAFDYGQGRNASGRPLELKLRERTSTLTASPTLPEKRKSFWTDDELLDEARDTVIGDLVDVFIKDVKSRIVQPKIAEHLNAWEATNQNSHITSTPASPVKVKPESATSSLLKLPSSLSTKPNPSKVVVADVESTTTSALKALPSFSRRVKSTPSTKGSAQKSRRSKSRSVSEAPSSSVLSSLEDDEEGEERGNDRDSEDGGSEDDDQDDIVPARLSRSRKSSARPENSPPPSPKPSKKGSKPKVKPVKKVANIDYTSSEEEEDEEEDEADDENEKKDADEDVNMDVDEKEPQSVPIAPIVVPSLEVHDVAVADTPSPSGTEHIPRDPSPEMRLVAPASSSSSTVELLKSSAVQQNGLPTPPLTSRLEPSQAEQMQVGRASGVRKYAPPPPPAKKMVLQLERPQIEPPSDGGKFLSARQNLVTAFNVDSSRSLGRSDIDDFLLQFEQPKASTVFERIRFEGDGTPLQGLEKEKPPTGKKIDRHSASYLNADPTPSQLADWRNAKADRKHARAERRAEKAWLAKRAAERHIPLDPWDDGIGADEEDMYFLKLAIERSRSGMAMHPTPPSSEDEGDDMPTKIVTPSIRKKHSTGAARTEGYYQVSVAEKMANRPAVAHGKTKAKAATTEGGATSSASGHSVSRLARANVRGLVRGMELHKKVTETDTDVLKFNQLRTRKKQLTFSRSGIEGYGLFACEHIPAGEMVIEYVGELIRQQVADRREKAYERQGIGSSYLFRVDDDLVVDATKKGNLGRLINHCCAPNCTAKIITINNVKKIVIYAKTDIEPGEEVTYDYHFPHEEVKIPCLCGHPLCRKYLN